MKSLLPFLCLVLLGSTDISRTDELMGRFNPARHPDFTMIQREHTDKPQIYLRREVYDAFNKMAAEAQQSGIRFKIISATRSFDHQKAIWQRKWDDGKYRHLNDKDKALAILRYSSMPGSSRHHWGTDIDLNSLNNQWFESGEGKKMYDWLHANAHRYGFYQVYTSKENGRTGYSEEKWHWSYLPTAKNMLEEFNSLIQPETFSGFAGAHLAKELRIIEDYVNGIEVIDQKGAGQ